MTRRYDPEQTLTELRHALATRETSFREMGEILARAASAVRAELWPDRPDLAEAAGLGAVVAAATVAGHAPDGAPATLVNAVGLFGLGLVDAARAAAGRQDECRQATDTHCPRCGQCSCRPGRPRTDPGCMMHRPTSPHRQP